MPVFETSVILDVSPEQAFDFLIRPANHELLSPPEVGLRFTNAPVEFTLGSQFEFKVQAWGIVQTMKYEIIQFERPHVYVERQITGPLKQFRNETRLELNPQGKLLVTNVIEFAPPGGILGMMATESKLLENFEDGFYYRHQQLRKLLKETV